MVAYIIFKFKKTSRGMGPVQLNIYVGQKHPCNYVISRHGSPAQCLFLSEPKKKMSFTVIPKTK